MKKLVVCHSALVLVAFALVNCAYALEIVSPAEGEVFCAHKPEHSRFLAMDRDARRKQFLDKAWRARIVQSDLFSFPNPLRLVWKDGKAPYDVKIMLGGKTVFATNTVETFAEVHNLEIAREYVWTVCSGGECASGRFRTSDTPPRMMHVPGVNNIRDIGGWIGLDGRRIKQGMAYRSGGLNYNAHTYYTCEETLAFYEAGVLEDKFGEIGRKVKEQIERDKGEFKFDPKAPFLRKSIIKEMHKGRERMTPEGIHIANEVLGMKSDIDLRSANECWGMTGSPLGDKVRWWHYSILPYARMANPEVKENIKHIFKAFACINSGLHIFRILADGLQTVVRILLVDILVKIGLTHLYRQVICTGAINGFIGTAVCIQLYQITLLFINIYTVVCHTHLLGKHVATHVLTVHVQLDRNNVVGVHCTGHLTYLHCNGISHK